MDYKQAETYIIDNNISRTQTYYNVIFKKIKEENKNSPNDGYKIMTNILKEHFNDTNAGLFKSIQMFLPMIQSCNTSEEIEDTLKIFPEELQDNVQFLNTWLSRHIDLLQHSNDKLNTIKRLKNKIFECKHLINIDIVNTYLRGLKLIDKHIIISEIIDDQEYIDLEKLFKISKRIRINNRTRFLIKESNSYFNKKQYTKNV